MEGQTMDKGSGTLYIVSLPIGNLADITLRAIETLRSADFIIAEDTRTTKRILTRYRIGTPFYSSIYQGAERRRIERLLDLLKTGKDLALVSDAGTPLISDPGYPLVRAAIERMRRRQSLRGILVLLTVGVLLPVLLSTAVGIISLVLGRRSDPLVVAVLVMMCRFSSELLRTLSFLHQETPNKKLKALFHRAFFLCLLFLCC